MSNTFDYPNSTALITGASSGIGAAMAEALAQRGCSIILSARDPAKLEARAAHLRQAYNVNATVVTADLSQHHGTLDLQAEIVRRALGVERYLQGRPETGGRQFTGHVTPLLQIPPNDVPSERLDSMSRATFQSTVPPRTE